MGYLREAKTYRLVFADTDMEGLEVTAKGLSFGDLLAVNRLSRDDPGATREEQENLLNERFQTMLDNFTGWNLEVLDGDGTRVPAPMTLETLWSQDRGFVVALHTAWLAAVSGRVPDPLEQPSSNGEPSPAASIPMDDL
jgi:hypothetical protein